jgi:hypothetical protein
MSRYKVEYYNKVWRDWLAFDQWFYETKEQAEKQIEFYKKKYPEFETRIAQIDIPDERPKRKARKNLGTKVSVEKTRTY